MTATTVYEQALGTARSGARAVGEHLPLERLADVDWSDTPLSDISLPDISLPDIDFDDVVDDVNRAVRRYPVATVAIVAATALVTCGVVWFVIRRRHRGADEQAELSLAGAA